MSMPRPIIGGDDAEDLGGGMERVAHIDGDERAEAAEDEHSRGHGEDDEEQRGVVDDEVDALLHVEPDLARWRRCPRSCGVVGTGCGLARGLDEGDGGDEQAEPTKLTESRM